MHLVELAKILGKSVLLRKGPAESNVPMIRSLMQMFHYRITWKKRDLDYLPRCNLSKKFMTARKAAELIPDGATVVSTGIASNSRCSIYYWAIRDRYERTGHPQDLTWITVAGVGGRGKVPGTIEEIGLPGLVRQHIGGHLETHKSLLMLADSDELELHTMPQGVLAYLIEGQCRGYMNYKSRVGVGTFLDPRVGRGSKISNAGTKNYIEENGSELIYSLPAVNVAVICVPYADEEGNLYVRNAAAITETIEASKASHANGGLVLATACDIIFKDDAAIAIPADMVDAIVINPRNEQTGGVLQRKYFPMFTPGSRAIINKAYQLINFANTFTGVTPFRGQVEKAMARMAASLFVKEAEPGSLINIGIGMPEEVSKLLFESGLYRNLVFSTEGGVYGGMPVSGMYFGSSINPERLLSSAEMFKIYEERLQVAVLGFLQVDSEGNVNVSKRGPRMIDYVGPGGFTNIAESAKTIIFIGRFMEDAEVSIKKGKIIIKKDGVAKFVDKVDEISFNAKKAVEMKKKVYYVTTIGILRLTEDGLELIQIMPGVNIRRDIFGNCGAKIIIPWEKKIPVLAPEIVTGKGFRLSFDKGRPYKQPDAAEGAASFLEKRDPRWKMSSSRGLPDFIKRN